MFISTQRNDVYCQLLLQVFLELSFAEWFQVIRDTLFIWKQNKI